MMDPATIATYGLKYGLPAIGSLWSAFTGSKAQGKQSEYDKMMADIANEQLKMQQSQFGVEQPFRADLLKSLAQRQNQEMPRFMPQGIQFSNPYERLQRSGVPGESGKSSFRPAGLNLASANMAPALAQGQGGTNVQNPATMTPEQQLAAAQSRIENQKQMALMAAQRQRQG